jgi:signal transduction histidine kinase
VALPVGQSQQSVRVLRTVLLIAYPLLVGGLAALAWRVVGATLRPVEDLRAGAERLAAGGDGLIAGGRGGGERGAAGAGAERLPVPDGRDEIHRLATTLNQMLDRQEAARARQRSFVADAAHELRSPLANLRVALEVAGHHGEAPPVEDLLADVDRLIRLADDLLLLARTETRAPARAAPVELVDLASRTAERYPGVRVKPALYGPQWTVGDEVALERAVANLLDNAVRHARDAVTVAVTRDGESVLVTVADDGPGIPAADAERVFDRFTRLDDARTRDAGGAGLGLAIVREIVTAHGGTVRLADADPGVRAEIRLPAARRLADGPTPGTG